MSDTMGGDRRSFLKNTALAGAGALGAAAMPDRAWAAATAGHATSEWSAEARIRELGIVLPPLDADQQQAPMLVPAVRTGNLLFVSGHGPRGEDGRYITGKVGADLTEEQGNAAARAAANTMLAAMRTFLGGNLDSVARVVKVLGMVNASPEFTQQPRVINGFSQVMIDVFGDNGRAARSAVGVGSLPGNWAVEVEAIFELKA
jgi:enamine deaminase RidA (YjgF/YER057c/UK114 family)